MNSTYFLDMLPAANITGCFNLSLPIPSFTGFLKYLPSHSLQNNLELFDQLRESSSSIPILIGALLYLLTSLVTHFVGGWVFENLIIYLTVEVERFCIGALGDFELLLEYRERRYRRLQIQDERIRNR